MEDVSRPRLSTRHVLGAALALGVLDLVFIGLFIAHALAVKHGWQTPLSSSYFNINRDGGLAEWFEYAKSATAALALIACARAADSRAFRVLAGLHVWIAADNSLRLHEQLGGLIGEALFRGDVLGLIPARDAGQVIFHGLVLATASAFLWLTARREPRRLWPTLGVLFLATIAAGFFGVVVDAYHASSLSEGVSGWVLILVEDGGETIMLSLACAVSIGCWFALRQRPAAPLPDAA